MSEDSVVRRIIDEHVIEGKRLGRHVEHDPRSRDYAFEATAGTLVAVEHKRHAVIFDQGQLGSCTGNAAMGARMTEPLWDSDDHTTAEAGAVDIYSLATRLDGMSDGYYPPTDTGSSGLAVAKAMKQLGLIGSYSHAFDMDAALSALQIGPVITGVSWYQGFDSPDSNGVVRISGSVRGGHEIVARGYTPSATGNPDDAVILLDNSWGTSYGVNGHFRWTVGTWKQLLADGGDVTILHR